MEFEIGVICEVGFAGDEQVYSNFIELLNVLKFQNGVEGFKLKVFLVILFERKKRKEKKEVLD